MKKCFLEGHGNCGGKISGEHYISNTALQGISRNEITVQIGGLPWQPKETLQRIGIQSLVSNVLCETHNSKLSELDSTASELFRVLDAADKRPETLPVNTTIDGSRVERWFLKVLCGLAAGAGFNNGVVPDTWCKALCGEQWLDGWGLYAPKLEGPQVLATEFYLDTMTNPDTRELKAAKFRVAGVHFTVLLGRPDHAKAWGTYRPRGVIFQLEQGEKRLEFRWPFDTDEAVVYTKVGTVKSRAPQWNGWKE